MQAENKEKPKAIKKPKPVVHDTLTKVFENKISYLKLTSITYTTIVKVLSEINFKNKRQRTAKQQVLC